MLSAMRCVRCGRALFSTPAVSIQSRAGPLHFGPKCAEIAGLAEKTRKAGKVSPPRKRPETESVDGQLDLFAQ